ncbi:MAG: autoinducer 2 ABC transporter substrate-binding protein [Propioniciclava sp.]
MTTSRRTLLGVVGAGALASLVGCSTTDPNAAPTTASATGTSAAAAAGDVKIFMAPKFTGLAYFEVARTGGEQAAADGGFTFEYIGSDQATTTAQIATLTNALPQKPSALVVSAIDGDAVAPALKQAMGDGIKVVTYDADAAADARDIFVNQLSYELAAKTMLDSAKLNSPDGGLVAFISASPSAPNHAAHVKFMKEFIDNDPDYQMFSYVDTVQFAGDDAAKSQEVTRNLIQAHPDLKVVISSSAVSAPAAQQAIIDAGKAGEMWGTGVALPSSVSEFIKAGHSQAFCMWDPAELGYIATVVAQRLVTGEIQGTVGETVDLGERGTYEILEGGEMQYNKPLIFTPDNIDDYDF